MSPTAWSIVSASRMEYPPIPEPAADVPDGVMSRPIPRGFPYR